MFCDNLAADDVDFLKGVTDFVDTVRGDVHDRDQRGEYPADLVPDLRELGLFSSCTRRLDVYALAMEEVGRAWLSLVPIVNAHSSSVWTVKKFGTPDQQDRWLPDLLSGATPAALGLTEPSAGSDLKAITTRAERVGDQWHITGNKALITHAEHASRLLLLARTDGTEHLGHRGLGLFLLERSEWQVVRSIPKLGSRAIETCEVTLDVKVPANRLVGGEPGQGFKQIMDALEVGRIAVAAAAIGVARSALWNGVDYANQRQAFGTRVSDFGATRGKLGAAAQQIAAAKALTLAAARAKQAGGRHDIATSAAKVAAAHAAVDTALATLEFGGGWGYTEDLEFARLLRDSALFIAGEGSNAVLADLIGRATAASSTSLDWI